MLESIMTSATVVLQFAMQGPVCPTPTSSWLNGAYAYWMSRQVTARPLYGGIVLPLAIGAVVDGDPTTFHTPLSGQFCPVRAVVPIGTRFRVTTMWSLSRLGPTGTAGTGSRSPEAPLGFGTQAPDYLSPGRWTPTGPASRVHPSGP